MVGWARATWQDLECAGLGTNEDNAVFLQLLGKVALLREKPVPGVDRIGPELAGRVDEEIDPQIRVGGGVACQPNGRIGFGDERGVSIGGRLQMFSDRWSLNLELLQLGAFKLEAFIKKIKCVLTTCNFKSLGHRDYLEKR